MHNDTDTNPTRRALMRSTALIALGGVGLPIARASYGQADALGKGGDSSLYRRQGEDPTFAKLVKDGTIIVGKQTSTGVKGSTIHVNNDRVERGPNADNPIPKDIRLHTLCHSHIKRSDFDKWTRWYQEDGNTQVFRLFEGEHNCRNDRPDAGRIEAYSALKWKKGEQWHTWEGTYTIIKPHGCMIFQVKNNENDWGVSILMNDKGDIKINHRRGQEDQVIAEAMVERPFVLTVRDNGHDYEVYLNRRKVGEGSFDRPKGQTGFRWGMYGKTFRHDAMLFVTGAAFE